MAAEILSGSTAALDLDARARDFVNPDKQVHTSADALLGVGHILAEDFSERADLRDRLRKILKRTGKLVCSRIETDEKEKRQETRPEAAPAPQTTPLAGAGMRRRRHGRNAADHEPKRRDCR